MVVGTYLVLTARLGAFTLSQHFKLQTRGQGGDAFALGVFSQERTTFASGGFCLGGSFGLHDFADDFEAGGHLVLAHTARLAGEGVGQASQDRVQTNARWRVVATLEIGRASCRGRVCQYV